MICFVAKAFAVPDRTSGPNQTAQVEGRQDLLEGGAFCGGGGAISTWNNLTRKEKRAFAAQEYQSFSFVGGGSSRTPCIRPWDESCKINEAFY